MTDAASVAAAADMVGAAEALGPDDGRPARRATVPPDNGVEGDRTRPRKRLAASMLCGRKRREVGEEITS